MLAEANAKVIVAGEHAVLRGSSAIVVPLNNNKISITYENSSELKVCCDGNYSIANCERHWRFFLENAFKSCANIKPYGKWHVNINIPIGVGLGFSAALCVATSKIFAHLNLISQNDIFNFANKLEQPIHGKTSGCDIAGSMSNAPIVYKMPGILTSLEWRPTLAWSTPGPKSKTKDTVGKVESLNNSKIDIQMQQAAKQALCAWQEQNANQLANSIEMASDCFEQWGLVTPVMREHMALLKNMGAIAVKPTGAGGGGSILSLWQEKKPHGGINWIL